MLAASVLPAAFALYLAASSAYRDHYALLFGWIFLIDAAMLAIAVARGYEPLHAFSAVTTVLAVVIWISTAYLPGAVWPVIAFVALFVVFYLAAPAIAARFGDPFEGLGEHAVLASPLLLAAFPLLVVREPRAESPVVLFPALFALVIPDRVAIVRGADGPAVFHRRLLRARHRSGVVVAIPDPGHAETGVDHLCGVRLVVSRRSADCPAAWRATAAVRRARDRAAARVAPPGLLRRRASGRGRIVGARAAPRDSECGAVHRERQRVAADTRARRQPDFMDRAAGVVVRSGGRRRVVIVAARRRGVVAGHGGRIHLGPSLCGTSPPGRAPGDGRADRVARVVAGAARTPVPVRGGGQLRLGGATMAALRRAGRGDTRVQVLPRSRRGMRPFTSPRWR